MCTYVKGMLVVCLQCFISARTFIRQQKHTVLAQKFLNKHGLTCTLKLPMFLFAILLELFKGKKSRHPFIDVISISNFPLNQVDLKMTEIIKIAEDTKICNPGGLDSRDQSRSRLRLSFVSRPVFKTCRDRLFVYLGRD